MKGLASEKIFSSRVVLQGKKVKSKFDKNWPLGDLLFAIDFTFFDLYFFEKIMPMFLCKGSWGRVYDMGGGCAVKVQGANTLCGVNEWNFASRLMELRHPGLVQIGAMRKEWKDNVEHLLIYMELCGRHSAFDIIEQYGAFSLQAWKKAYNDIGSALLYLHANGLTHGDVKPENILLKDDHFKLCDFGMLSDLNTSAMPMGGSPYYIAPEKMDLQENSQEKVQEKKIQAIDLGSCDVWSFGVSMFVMHRATFLGSDAQIQQIFLQERALNFTPTTYATDRLQEKLCEEATILQYSLAWNPSIRILAL